jgi:hypothetical protein
MGALHPVVFFMLVYAISLFLAIFVCRTVYYSINNDVAGNPVQETHQQAGLSGASFSATALR